MAGVWARGASEKMWDPLRIFATVEASNFKFGAIEAPKALRGCGLWRGVSLPTGEGAGPHPQKKN